MGYLEITFAATACCIVGYWALEYYRLKRTGQRWDEDARTRKEKERGGK